ncbi:ligand-binding sensor domain-containing protein [Treponema bryantii]|uniref:Ligand-binding sensor domain-containing protein n=1 Tax=Treponema bryantii TaxID=163 RepID=A0A1H9GJY8_9SPIR|nr:adenylate/guanylate cyclase domain-containing protein [Treponema bryantii]SEQ50405.1 ligand-binding sensor domain-containing protein [Treponema bryantii]
MKKSAILLALLLGCFTAVYGQSAAEGKVDQTFLNDFVCRNWTTADGLPGMTITAIMQDQKGYIYVGTYEGLVRFDGVEFVTFSRNIDPKYDFASVRAIFQDTNGNLWVGHNDEGVTCIQPDGNILKYTTENGLPHNSIRAICEDFNNNIWLGTASGLCYLTPEHKVKIPEGLHELGQDTIQVSRLYCDTAGRIWISTAIENDLFVFSTRKLERFTGITKIKNPSVNEVSQDKSGAFWFGVAPHYAVRIKDTEETVFDIGHDHQEGTVVNSILQDTAGNFWFASDCGITILHNGVYTYYDKRNGLADDYINHIFEDHEGNMWIAYNRGGIEKMSQGKFRTIAMPIAVNAICEDPVRGVTWLGADNGLYCYNKDSQFVENKITELCKGARIRHVGMTSDGELLISSYSDISQVCVTSNDKITVWTMKDGLAGLKCRVSIKTTDGKYYVGTTQGLSIIEKDGSIHSLTRKEGFENEFIMSLYEDKKGQVWVGTDGGGIYILKDEQIIKHYNSENGLAGNVIFKTEPIEDSGLWIATGTGISKYNEESDTFANLNSANGLGTDSVFQMICDYTQTVWMTSNKGIFSVNLADMEDVTIGKRKKINAKYYGSSDGLNTGGITSTSVSTQDSLGRVWFTLIDGFAIYDPVKSGKNQIPPKIEIQEYSIDNVKYDYHGEKIILPPSAKRLSIKFTGLSFISSDQMRFCYRLGGFENNYSEWSNLRNVSYTNLKPGTYQFTVMSENGDEIKSKPSDPIIIIKKPYIWQQLWFQILVGVIIVGIATLIVFLKIHSMRRYQIELEKKVEERTHDLKLEKEKSEKLLLNILPSEVAKELTEHPNQTIAKKFPNITVLFTDIVGFTKMSDGMTAEQVVTMLNKMVTLFDERAKREGIEKIKTIGDAYMAATGFTEEPDNDGAIRMVHFAIGLMEDVRRFNETSPANVQIRLGINTGNLVAGVIGKSKFIYDIWGDTVNVASRMESTGEPMKIHVTETTYLQTQEQFAYSEGIEVEVKGKGKMKTYFL